MIEYIIAVGMVLAAGLFSYKAGKNSTKAKHQEELIDVIHSARKARARLNDPKYVGELLNKYSK